MDLAPTQPDFTEHVFRSVRGWLHTMFPDENIFIHRDESQETNRPAFRLEVAAGPGWEESTQAWGFLTMSLVINYAAPRGEKALFEAQRVSGRIISNAVAPRGRIPLSLYSFSWPEPPEVTLAAVIGGTLPAALDVAVAAVGPEGSGSAPSAALQLAVPAGAVLSVRGVNWPPGKALASSWRVYAALAGQPLRLQGAMGVDEVFEMAELIVGTAPPQNQRLAIGGLRVESADTNFIEGTRSERQFDVAVTLRLRALVPRAWGAQLADELVP